MHFLVTGYTDFKGAWLTLMLTSSGHSVSGYSLAPQPGSLFERAVVADLAASYWDPGAAWENVGGNHPHEAGLLALDAGHARAEVSWQDRLNFDSAVNWTVTWYREALAGRDPLDLTRSQISQFEKLGS